MSRTDILEDIKKAEADAKVLVEKAEADKKAAIADARRASVQKIQDAEAQARSNYESSIAKEKEALASKREALLANGKSEADKIDEGIDAKLQKVKDYLNDEFVRTLDVSS